MLPKIVCAGCWPAYTAALSAFGIEFVDYTPYLIPATIVFLAVTLASLALLAHRRRRYEPFALGLIASSAVLAGKFAFESDIVMYVGVATLVAVSLIPWRSKQATACPACELR